MLKLMLLVLIFVTLLVFIRLILLRMKQVPPPVLKTPSPPLGANVRVRRQEEMKQSNLLGRLSGKVAIITGAGSGIGRACTIAFAHEGSRVVLVGRRRQPLEEVAREIGEAAFICPGDVGVKADIESIVYRVTQHFGTINVLVNNAGKLVAGTAESHSEKDWDETFNTNVKGLWLLSREVLPHLRKSGGGSIINISSVLGLTGAKNRLAYSASKGAVTLFTKAMALDHAHEQIRVNAICPGIVDTELVAQFIANAPDPEEARQQRIALHPLGRFGTPEDVASMAVYLACDESRWVTGTAFPVDGGYSAV